MITDSLHAPAGLIPASCPPNAVALRRIGHGLSQAQVAGELGVTPSTYSRWEAGKTYPNPTQVRDLARILALPFGELLGLLAVIWESAHQEEATHAA